MTQRNILGLAFFIPLFWFFSSGESAGIGHFSARGPAHVSAARGSSCKAQLYMARSVTGSVAGPAERKDDLLLARLIYRGKRTVRRFSLMPRYHCLPAVPPPRRPRSVRLLVGRSVSGRLPADRSFRIENILSGLVKIRGQMKCKL